MSSQLPELQSFGVHALPQKGDVHYRNLASRNAPGTEWTGRPTVTRPLDTKVTRRCDQCQIIFVLRFPLKALESDGWTALGCSLEDINTKGSLTPSVMPMSPFYWCSTSLVSSMFFCIGVSPRSKWVLKILDNGHIMDHHCEQVEETSSVPQQNQTGLLLTDNKSYAVW